MESKKENKHLSHFNELLGSELKQEWDTNKMPAIREPIRVVPISTSGVYHLINACVNELASEFKEIDVPLTIYHLAIITAFQINRKINLSYIKHAKEIRPYMTTEEACLVLTPYNHIDHNLRPIVDYIDHIGMFKIQGQTHLPQIRHLTDVAWLPLVNCHPHSVWKAAHLDQEFKPESYEENYRLKTVLSELKQVVPTPQSLDKEPTVEQSEQYVADLFSSCRRRLDERAWKDFIATVDYDAEGSPAQLVGSKRLDETKQDISCWCAEPVPFESLIIGGVYGFGRTLVGELPPIHTSDVAVIRSDAFFPQSLIERMVRMHRKHT